jgi:hypothetical protein
MFKPAPIDQNYRPYTHRSRGKNNGGLLVDGDKSDNHDAGRRSAHQMQVSLASCDDKFDCWPGYACVHGECV